MVRAKAGTSHCENCLTNGGESLGDVLFGDRTLRIGNPLGSPS